ncbi:hypothetical protein PR202_gb00856 [Eleusine coracana subsp. coracana]|uniref:Uncharacterized protein n=1 Tax=Eleusine coracana subsp. coracana TaxID=191504 RepID=A0AAV5DUG7_ELECO|nr:hypothetical protein PR202_gb00856 [Eleusine coracana subsp. coracana]
MKEGRAGRASWEDGGSDDGKAGEHEGCTRGEARQRGSHPTRSPNASPSPPLVALSKTAAAATRRAATAAASVAARRLLLPVRSPPPIPAVTSCLILRRRLHHMPREDNRAPPVSLPLQSRSFAVAMGAGDVDGESPALAVVSFYRFADLPDHADFRQPLKQLCQELVSAQRSHLHRDFISFDILSPEIEALGGVL